MDSRIRELIFLAVDERISQSEFEQLQDAMESNAEARAEYLRAVRLSEMLGNPLSSGDLDELLHLGTPGDLDSADNLGQREGDSARGQISVDAAKHGLSGRGRFLSWGLLALAATVLVAATGSAFWLGRRNRVESPSMAKAERNTAVSAETQIAGHATLRRAVDVVWLSGEKGWREGDVLPNGEFAFGQGVAEIDFFCGATLIVEGPAELEIESDWSVRIAEGRLRATVPPAARGFIVKAEDSEIIDLGTEFAVEVAKNQARVEVIDGEVKLRGGQHHGKHLLTGDSESLKGTVDHGRLSEQLSTFADIQDRQRQAERNRFEAWQVHVDELKSDDRLIAFFPIAASQRGRVVDDVSRAKSVSTGLLVGPVDRTGGRFGAVSTGLSFDRPGARVRTRIDGDFQAFTFSCWARIDRLEHRYNALFMADGYETGEPHWQIRDDGRLMFSVMVDDTQDVQFYNQREQRTVRDAGLHRVYYTEPFFDASDSGKWFHLAAVYDPPGKRVTQFVNGIQVASEAIEQPYQISKLRIGAGEIGNWGQPFRESPWFAVRNLNGTIDELVIFDAALSSEEVAELYRVGKPLGY